jgi:hypothetical protein
MCSGIGSVLHLTFGQGNHTKVNRERRETNRDQQHRSSEDDNCPAPLLVARRNSVSESGDSISHDDYPFRGPLIVQ